MKAIVLFLLACVAAVAADQNYSVGQTVAELRLVDHKVLTNVKILSVGSTSILAKWDGGRGSIAFENLPKEAALQLSSLKPSPKPLPADESAPPFPARLNGPIGDQSGAEQIVSGQIFITSENGSNHRLGGVVVRAYGNKEFADLINEIRPKLKAVSEFYTRQFDKLREAGRYEEALVYSSQALELIGQELEFLPDSPKTITDADGNFELHHRFVGKYWIAARASRMVGAQREYYSWKFPSGDLPKSGRLILTNNNLE